MFDLESSRPRRGRWREGLAEFVAIDGRINETPRPRHQSVGESNPMRSGHFDRDASLEASAPGRRRGAVDPLFGDEGPNHRVVGAGEGSIVDRDAVIKDVHVLAEWEDITSAIADEPHVKRLVPGNRRRRLHLGMPGRGIDSVDLYGIKPVRPSALDDRSQSRVPAVDVGASLHPTGEHLEDSIRLPVVERADDHFAPDRVKNIVVVGCQGHQRGIRKSSGDETDGVAREEDEAQDGRDEHDRQHELHGDASVPPSSGVVDGAHAGGGSAFRASTHSGIDLLVALEAAGKRVGAIAPRGLTVRDHFAPQEKQPDEGDHHLCRADERLAACEDDRGDARRAQGDILDRADADSVGPRAEESSGQLCWR